MARITSEDLQGIEVAGQVPPMMTDAYVLRIINTDNKPSKSSGNKMVTLEVEIVRPEKITRSGVPYVVSGLKTKYYFTVQSQKGAKETKVCQKAYYEFRKLMGVTPDFDSESPEHEDLRGLGFKAILHSQERVATRVEENGQRVQIVDESTGQPLSKGWEINKFNNEILEKVELES